MKSIREVRFLCAETLLFQKDRDRDLSVTVKVTFTQEQSMKS